MSERAMRLESRWLGSRYDSRILNDDGLAD
jgi:hypothetical protein